jgi:adenosylmethionine-8-amino-7-oxononanoate aminotransferase
MAEQVARMAYYSPFNNLTNEPATLLAARLAELSPANHNHVYYRCGGSVDNDTAIRLDHYYFNQKVMPRKKKILARKSGYHGTTYLAATLTGTVSGNWGFDTIEGLVTHLSEANCYRRPEGMSESEYGDFLVDEFRETVKRLGADNVAAFIAEPIMGAGGVLVAPEGYHRRIWEICRENGLLYISDEVVTAFGRLGHYFSSEAVFGIQPDIINIAKGLTSAYAPLGATLISDEIHEVISRPQCKDGIFSTGYTYSGHPVSCAAALANLAIMERENLCRHVRETGPYLKAQLQKRLSRHEMVGDIRGSHFMIGIENVANRHTRAIFPGEARVGQRIADECQKRGFIIRPLKHINIISPPLIWTREVIDEIVDILDQSIEAVAHALQKDGFVAPRSDRG